MRRSTANAPQRNARGDAHVGLKGAILSGASLASRSTRGNLDALGATRAPATDAPLIATAKTNPRLAMYERHPGKSLSRIGSLQYWQRGAAGAGRRRRHETRTDHIAPFGDHVFIRFLHRVLNNHEETVKS
jgi:hypothetical protein